MNKYHELILSLDEIEWSTVKAQYTDLAFKIDEKNAEALINANKKKCFEIQNEIFELMEKKEIQKNLLDLNNLKTRKELNEYDNLVHLI